MWAIVDPRQYAAGKIVAPSLYITPGISGAINKYLETPILSESTTAGSKPIHSKSCQNW